MAVVSLQTLPEKTTDLTWTPAFWRAETARLDGVLAWKNYRVWPTALVAVTAVVVAIFSYPPAHRRRYRRTRPSTHPASASVTAFARMIGRSSVSTP